MCPLSVAAGAYVRTSHRTRSSENVFTPLVFLSFTPFLVNLVLLERIIQHFAKSPKL